MMSEADLLVNMQAGGMRGLDQTKTESVLPGYSKRKQERRRKGKQVEQSRKAMMMIIKNPVSPFFSCATLRFTCSSVYQIPILLAHIDQLCNILTE